MTQVIEKVARVHLDEGRLPAARTPGRDLFHLPGGKPEPGLGLGQFAVPRVPRARPPWPARWRR
ncbi:hypothetical protein [Kitasatospora sp. NPDC093102]|uniref:hypothetical protein n=1 Tax=Kitasatospora sp. NPDC093102 TaxID=3155069 RepID=UPI003424F70A